MSRKLFGVLLSALLTLPAVANAASWSFGGALSTGQETTPPTLPSPYFGGGVFLGTLDDDSGAFTLQVVAAGLTGPLLAAHIHAAAPGVDGPVVLDLLALLTPGGPVIPGFAILNVETTLDAAGIAMLTGSGTSLAGAIVPAYINLHTAANPGGELRGQLLVTQSPVPVPAAVWMLGSALAGLVTLRRRA